MGIMEKYREKIWFSIGLNLCVCGLMLAMMSPFYDNDKDIYMRVLVNGALGTNVFDILYQSPFLGKIYSVLYGRFGARFCWYDLFQLAVLLAAFTVITYLIIQMRKEESGIWLSLLFLIFFGYECLIEMSFIKTAGTASIAGTLLLICVIRAGERKKIAVLIGMLLSLAGALLCLPACIFCIGLTILAAGMLFWGKRGCTHKIKTVLAVISIAGCTVFLLSRTGTVLRSFLNEAVKSLTFCAFLFAVLLWCICKRKKAYVWIIGAAGVTLWLSIAVLIFEEAPGSGAQELLCMMGILACLTALSGEKIQIERQTCVILLILSLIMSQYTWRANWRITNGDERARQTYDQHMLGTIAADREHLYLFAPGTVDYGRVFKPFESMPTEVMGNNCALDAWIINQPVCRKIMKKYGVEEPLRDMIGNSAVYLVGGDIGKIMEDIHNSYDKDVKALPVSEVQDKKIYQIR